MDRLDFVKRVLLLPDKGLEEITTGKDSSSVFAVYMAAVNFDDYGHHIFKEHDMNMHTRLPDDRDVDGFRCLYDVLLRTPFSHRKDGDLFSFIRNNLILNRDLKEGELL